MKKNLLTGKKVNLRQPEETDGAEFIELGRKSVKFHRRLVKVPDTQEGFLRYVERCQAETNAGFLVVRREDNTIAGTVMLSQIFYGVLCSAYLGYWLGTGFTGKGLMAEAVDLIVRHAFRDLKLHRVEANIQPENAPSIAVVRRNGFTKEGFSRKYLKIGGKWCDHERWAIIKEDWMAGR